MSLYVVYIQKNKMLLYIIFRQGDRMSLNKDIGNRFRKIRGKITQQKSVEKLDLLGEMSRSYYSMVEIGMRPASLHLLDMISGQKNVSYDYIFGIVNSRVNIYDPKYHQLLEQWSKASD